MTKLKSALKRELAIGKAAYALTIDPEGLKLVVKGKRNGVELAWRDLVSGDAAMAVALRASLGTARPSSRTRREEASRLNEQKNSRTETSRRRAS
jgi:hypothetical protein